MKPHRRMGSAGAWLVAGAALLLGMSGCAAGAGDAKTAQEPTKGAPRLWAENCARCHNGRPAAEFSDRQWSVIVHHMRVRANLTAEEQRQILAFLQASN